MNIIFPAQNQPLKVCNETRSYGFWLSILLGPIFLGAAIALPIRIAAWFDGLPWAGSIETLVVSVLLPFLVIAGYRFLFLRWSIIFLFALFLLKIIMFAGAPASGWQVKVYPDMTLEEVKKNMWREEMYDAVTSGKWVRTYATNWIGKFSAILQSSWDRKNQFPLDWFLPHRVAKKNEKEQFDSLQPWIGFEGAVTLPSRSSLVLVAQGMVNGNLEFLGLDGKLTVVPLAKDLQEARDKAMHAPKGSGRITGKLQFKGLKWSFMPVLIDEDGVVNSKLGRSVLWQDSSVLSISSGTILFFNALSWIIDIGMTLFFITWGAWSFLFLIQEKILTLPLAVFSTVVVFLTFALDPFYTFVIETFHYIDPSKITNLGFSVVLVGVSFLLWTCWKDDYRNFQAERMGTTVFLLFGPAILIFFSNKWFPQIGHWSLWS